MNKLYKLVINEYIKILGKLSTKILLGIVVAGAFCFIWLLYNGENSENPRRRFHFPNEMTLEERIRNAESGQQDGWQRTVELYTYFIENEIPYISQRTLNNRRVEQDPEAWRTGAVYRLFEARWAVAGVRANEYVTAMDEAIRSNDWLGYMSALLDLVTHTQRNPTPEESIQLWSLQQTIAHNAHPGSWQHDEIMEMQTAKLSLLRQDEMTAPRTRDIITLGEYRLANGTEHYTFRGMEEIFFIDALPGIWRGLSASLILVTVLGILLIIVAGSVVAGEHSAGTIKFLLINPVMRWKFLLAKYIAVLTFGLGLVILLFILNFIFSGLFFGFEGLNAPFLSVADGEVVHGSAVLYMVSRYLLSSVGMMVIATFAFAISALVRSSALAIGLGMFLFMAGAMAIEILQNLGFYQAKYILFANTQLLSVINGTTGFVHHTLTFAILNIGAYMAVFLLTAWDAFTRSDIK